MLCAAAAVAVFVPSHFSFLLLFIFIDFLTCWYFFCGTVLSSRHTSSSTPGAGAGAVGAAMVPSGGGGGGAAAAALTITLSIC